MYLRLIHLPFLIKGLSEPEMNKTIIFSFRKFQSGCQIGYRPIKFLNDKKQISDGTQQISTDGVLILWSRQQIKSFLEFF